MKNKYIISIAFITWIFIQGIIILIFNNIEQTPDAYGYMNNALFCYENQCIAPSIRECFGLYVQAPGYTNYLLIIYSLFHSFKPIMWLNLLMNIFIIYEIYWLGTHLYTKKIGLCASILFALMVNNLFVPIQILSEQLFLFIGLSSFILVYKGSYRSIFIASILFAVGFTIKPLIYAYFIPAIVLLVTRKCNWKKYIVILLPYIVILQLYGYTIQSNTGVKVTSSTTGGFCLCMSAVSPWADYTVFQKGNFAYIENEHELNVVQKDSIRKEKAIKIILENPYKYITNCLKKPLLLFEADSWAIHWPFWDKLNNKLSEIENKNLSNYIRMTIKYLIKIPYSIVLLLFILSLFVKPNEIFSTKGIILLILLLGIGATCLFHVECRYHYPYMFVLCIWAARLFEYIPPIITRFIQRNN